MSDIKENCLDCGRPLVEGYPFKTHECCWRKLHFRNVAHTYRHDLDERFVITVPVCSKCLKPSPYYKSFITI